MQKVNVVYTEHILQSDIKRRIEKKEKALRKIEAAKKWRKDKNKWWWSVKEGAD